MKLLSAFGAAVTAAALFINAFPANAETALSATVSGDIDLNSKITISDLLTMQNYLHGKKSLSEQAFLNADINGDGSADVIDMCLLRKKLLSAAGGITKTVSDLHYSTNQKAHENIITSVDELNGFFAPLYVITVDGDCIDAETTSEDDIKKYAEIYNEEFFKDNILLLKVVEKPYGGENNIGNVYYSDEYWKAEFYQTYSGDNSNDYEHYFQLLQVVIPRSLNKAKGFEWIYNYPDAKAEITSEFTREATSSGWKTAINGNGAQLFPNKRLFDKWIDGKFHSAVERELKNRYDDEFFENSDLVIDLYANNNENLLITPTAEITSYKVKLTYDRKITNSENGTGVNITQVVIPKGSCYDKKTETVRNGQSKTTLSYKEFDLGMECMTHNKDMVKTYASDPEWVHSQEELDEFLGECLTDEAIELLDLKTNGHSAYVWLDSDIIGAKHSLAASYVSKEEKSLELNMLTEVPFGDEGGLFLHILYTPSDWAEYEVKINDFSIMDKYPTYDSYPVEIEFSDENGYDYRTLFVNQYSFGNEYSADLYLAYPGGGPIRYSRYEYIGTIELSPDFKPFSKEYKYIDNEYGKNSASGDAFNVAYSDGILKVSCKTAPDSEYETLEIDIGK